MTKRLSPSAVISGEEDSLSEIIFDGSDELGIEDEDPFDYEPPFEPLEVDQGKTIIKYMIYINACNVFVCVCSFKIHQLMYIDLEVNGETFH